jgi:DNA modification methylase
MRIETEDYTITNADCIPTMHAMAPASVDLAIFSPPFSSLYAYTDADADMGNSRESDDEFLLHFDFFCAALAPLIKPGRNVCLHIQQVSRFKGIHGFTGLYDIRGAMIRLMEAAGLVYYGDVTIPKNPQAQSIRTKSHCLTFTSFEKDSLTSRPALSDYLLVFKQRGSPEVPVCQGDGSDGRVSRDEWIEFAEGVWDAKDDLSDLSLTEGLREMYDRGEPLPVWTGIKETDTLNTDAAKADEDERHVCPLQLPLIDRCVRLWSNKGEVVFSPFMGVGSEGFKALGRHRRFVGVELNPRYFGVAHKNLDRALRERDAQQPLFGFGAA